MCLYSLYSALHMTTSTMFSIIVRRLERDSPSMKPVDKFTLKTMRRSVTSPHVIMVFTMSFMNGTMLYGLAYFLPTIVKQLGFSNNKTQLLSVGPFAVGFLGAFFFFFCGAIISGLCTCFCSDVSLRILVRPL